MQTFSIRPATEDDAGALATLSGELGYPADCATMCTRLQRLRDAAAGEVFVAIDDADQVLGWTHVAPRLNLEEAPFAELAGLIVAERARGSGIGLQLLDAAQRWARAHGYRKLRVRSNIVRERAHRFYLREGYAERKRQAVFEKILDP